MNSNIVRQRHDPVSKDSFCFWILEDYHEGYFHLLGKLVLEPSLFTIKMVYNR